MKFTSFRSSSLLVVAASLVLFGCSSMPSSPGWTTLVDGAKGMENFNAIGDANWR